MRDLAFFAALFSAAILPTTAAHGQPRTDQSPETAIVFMWAVVQAGGVTFRSLDKFTGQPDGDWKPASGTWEASSNCVLGLNIRGGEPEALDVTNIEVIYRRDDTVIFGGSQRFEMKFPSPARAARFAWASEVLRQSCDPTNGFGF